MGDADEKGTTSTCGTKIESSSNSTTPSFSEEGYSAQIKLANEPLCQTDSKCSRKIFFLNKSSLERNPSRAPQAGPWRAGLDSWQVPAGGRMTVLRLTDNPNLHQPSTVITGSQLSLEV